MELYGAEGSGTPVELPVLATEFSPTPGSATLAVVRRRKKGVRPPPQLPNKYIMLLMRSMMYPLNELSLPLLGLAITLLRPQNFAKLYSRSSQNFCSTHLGE